jgi:hypothetical protein
MPRLKPINVREPTVTEQRCTSCRKVKPADQFHRDPSLLSGLRTRCKVCELTVQRERYARVGKKRTGHASSDKLKSAAPPSERARSTRRARSRRPTG